MRAQAILSGANIVGCTHTTGVSSSLLTEAEWGSCCSRALRLDSTFLYKTT